MTYLAIILLALSNICCLILWLRVSKQVKYSKSDHQVKVNRLFELHRIVEYTITKQADLHIFVIPCQGWSADVVKDGITISSTKGAPNQIAMLEQLLQETITVAVESEA